MKKLIPLLLLAGCNANSGLDCVTQIRQDQLFAMNEETLPIRYESPELTNEDIERLGRDYPKTLERIKKGKPLTVQDIKNMTRSGVTDTAIITKITESRSLFYLTPDEEKDLTAAGVSTKVIDAMKATSDSSY